MARRKSWVQSANDPETPFPLENLPLGVFETAGQRPRQGVALGDQIIDMGALAAHPLFQSDPRAGLLPPTLFAGTSWNAFMAAGHAAWQAFRALMTELFSTEAHAEALDPLLHKQSTASLHMPFEVAEFTDFYAGRAHAENVGTMFRGPENALPPNWLHMPIGYNGRASSVVVSGTPVRRPWGQVKNAGDTAPCWQPSARFDFELELGAIVGQPSDRPLDLDAAQRNIFGFMLLNDWSARDIQAWEYQPLGPFQSKATATSISPWIVMKDALAPFLRDPPGRDAPLLPHLRDRGPMFYDIDLEVLLTPEGGVPQRICQTNASQLYYSAAQQLTHHTSAGCPMRVGDLLGSGTISGAAPDARGSMLELGWGGETPLDLEDGTRRSFLEDGDTITLRGAARGDGFHIGFGECTGTVLPAAQDPFEGD
jgi:fumarylacetoacetase